MDEIVKIISHWKAQLPDNWTYVIQPTSSDIRVTWSYPTPSQPISKTTLSLSFQSDTFKVEFENKSYSLAEAYDYECVNFLTIVNAKELQLKQLQKRLTQVDYVVHINEIQLDVFDVPTHPDFARANADAFMKSSLKMTKEEAFALVEALNS